MLPLPGHAPFLSERGQMGLHPLVLPGTVEGGPEATGSFSGFSQHPGTCSGSPTLSSQDEKEQACGCHIKIQVYF